MGEHEEERQIVLLSIGQQGFIDRELALFESLQGVSHVAEHRIVMRDGKPLKQRYYPRPALFCKLFPIRKSASRRSATLRGATPMVCAFSSTMPWCVGMPLVEVIFLHTMYSNKATTRVITASVRIENRKLLDIVDSFLKFCRLKSWTCGIIQI